ncbi:MAG: hypothetical protein ACOYJF_02790 [Prevotella sp.]|jgi:hypothetical protein
MKKISTLLLCVALSLPIMADDYSYLNVKSADGTVTSLSVTNLKITFSNGKLVATNDSGTTSLTLSDLSQMYFSNTSTGIDNVTDETADEAVTAYTIAGQKVGEYKNATEATQQLPQGAYLLKSKSQTLKVLVP